VLASKKSSPHSGVLFAVRNRLYDTLALTAENICKEYSFSAGYFRQIYKDCFGISFHQDAICARISRAVHLLSTTVMSIAAIAEECGYEDYNYFLRQFQKVTGVTPGQFRRKNG
jgi:AraC-like DNA-binding protein